MIATDMKALLPEFAQRVTDHLRMLGYEKNIVMLPAIGETSAEAATELGYSVAGIAKSITSRRAEGDVPVLVTASGANRIDEAKVSMHVGALAKADTKFVRERTGYAVGGARPVSHAVKSVMPLDQDLFQYDNLWAAAGHPHAVFNLAPAEPEATTDAPVAGIVQRN